MESVSITITNEIKETKGALNNAENIAKKLAAAKVSFSVTKEKNIPGIWVKFEGEEKFVNIAILKAAATEDHILGCEEYDEWWVAFAKQNNYHNGYEEFIFHHLTDRAEKVVEAWRNNLCDQYFKKLAEQ